MSPEEQHTIEEFERVLRTKRFATIHDLVRADGLAELAAGSQRTGWAEHAGADELGSLPNRR